MIKTWVQNFTDIEMILFGMLMFLFVFVGITFITFHKGRKDYFHQMQNLPFEEKQP